MFIRLLYIYQRCTLHPFHVKKCQVLSSEGARRFYLLFLYSIQIESLSETLQYENTLTFIPNAYLLLLLLLSHYSVRILCVYFFFLVSLFLILTFFPTSLSLSLSLSLFLYWVIVFILPPSTYWLSYCPLNFVLLSWS